MFFKIFRSIALIVTFIWLFGCTTVSTIPPWPADLPPKQIFVDAYLSNRSIAAESADSAKIEEHLVWIKRFYQGTLFYQNGWNRVSKQFLDSVENKQERDDLKQRMVTLGITISNEWAQDNDVRLISSVNIATWGSALRTAAEQGDQLEFVSKVEADVLQLLTKTLQGSQISYQRYYPEEDYDNF